MYASSKRGGSGTVGITWLASKLGTLLRESSEA